MFDDCARCVQYVLVLLRPTALLLYQQVTFLSTGYVSNSFANWTAIYILQIWIEQKTVHRAWNQFSIMDLNFGETEIKI